jgi:hypothetical protein
MTRDIVSTSALFSIATLGLEEGGRIGVCALPGRFNSLTEDVETIAGWKPAIVLSLTELAEMENMGSERLGSLLAERGIGWKHLPIRDWSGMSGENAAVWPVLSKQLHGALDRGEGVLTHCHGGHGRSGMIALRLLVERGIEPGLALRRLRHVRPGAVEAPRQMHWATGGRL